MATGPKASRGHAAILGGGLAGAACAWALTRRGWRVTLFEREIGPGQHASGRNAGLIRRLERQPAIAALARQGADLLAAPPADLADAPLYRRTGSILVASHEGRDELDQDARVARAAGVELTLASPADFAPCSALATREGLAVHVPADGVAAPLEVLTAFSQAAKRAGADLWAGQPGELWVEDGRVVGVRSSRRDVRADVTINAAGPWAADLVANAGGLTLELQSYRRHLYWTGALPGIDPATPWVWDLDAGFYLRPESSGWLLCACDHEARPPEDTQAAQDAAERLANKVAQAAPSLSEHPIARSWAGLRTFAPDKRFVIGPDPVLGGLFWATGLGGHGLTTSGAVGQLVAELLEEPAHEFLPEAVQPEGSTGFSASATDPAGPRRPFTTAQLAEAFSPRRLLTAANPAGGSP